MSDTYLLQCANCGTEERIGHPDASQHRACTGCGAPLIASHCLPLEVDDASWDEEVLHSTAPTIVVVWGNSCATCAEYESSVRLMAGSLFGEARILRLNIDTNPATSARYEITGVPTVLLFEEGKRVRTLTGPQGEQGLRHMLNLGG